MPTTAERLQTFVNYVAEYLKGDEKGEAPIFLDKFFRAFGHEGAIEPASQLYQLHKELDALVLQAYGFGPDDDLLEKLLALNLELAAKEQRGEPVVGPWDPIAAPKD
jgi:hypothetical protein